MGLDGRAVEEILGYPDDLKSPLLDALFSKGAKISEENIVFSQALGKYFDGREDAGTVQRL